MATKDERLLLGELNGKVDMLVKGAEVVGKKIDELPCKASNCPMNGKNGKNGRFERLIVYPLLVAMVVGAYFR